MISVVIPVYGNAGSIDALVAALARTRRGSSAARSRWSSSWTAARTTRTCGSRRPCRRAPFPLPAPAPLAELRVVLRHPRRARGRRRASTSPCMAADLQEPPELVVEFARRLEAGAVRRRRRAADAAAPIPCSSRASAALFWALYRRFVQPEVPKGGVDVFGCTRAVRDQIVRLDGAQHLARRAPVLGRASGARRCRTSAASATPGGPRGPSARSSRYLMDSVFSFSDLPIRFLLRTGALGLALSVAFAAVVLTARLSGAIAVPGYAATVLTITFFGALNCFGLGVIGGYVWRTFENTKGRPDLHRRVVGAVRTGAAAHATRDGAMADFFKHPQALVETQARSGKGTRDLGVRPRPARRGRSARTATSAITRSSRTTSWSATA